LLARDPRSRYVFAIIGFFFFVFLLGSAAAMPRYRDYALGDNFVMVNKLVFVFICWEVLRRRFETAEQKAPLFCVFEGLVFVQSAVVILSFTFNWELFAPYRGARFGYAGLIPAQNEVSGFFVIAFFYFFTRLVSQGRSGIGALATTVAGLMTGTRVLLILPLILVLWVGPRVLRPRVKKSYAWIGAAAMLLAVTAWLARGYLLGRIEQSLAYFEYFLRMGGSPWKVLLGSRLFDVERFADGYLPGFGVINYLFGGHDLAAVSTESDLVDLFIRLGLIGGAVFAALYVRLLWRSGGRRAPTHGLFLVVWLGLAIVSGHVVFSAINGGYLAILLLAFSSAEAPERSQRSLSAQRGGRP
jgi:hypothetical protein